MSIYAYIIVVFFTFVIFTPLKAFLEMERNYYAMNQNHTQWDYKTLRPPRDETKKESTDPQAQLNAYGDNGWELAATIDYTGGGTKYLVFKRPVERTADSDEEFSS